MINTHGPAGQIHSRPVWVDTDGRHVVVNSVPGRTWVRDLDRTPNVTCTVVNQAEPYEFVTIEGRVVARTTEDAAEHIDFLAQKYLGLDRYPFSSTGARVKLLILPERILHMAPEDSGSADRLDRHRSDDSEEWRISFDAVGPDLPVDRRS